MRIASLAAALLLVAPPIVAQAQDLGLATDEQILLKQVMTDKRAIYAKNLGLSEDELVATCGGDGSAYAGARTPGAGRLQAAPPKTTEPSSA